MDLTLKKRPSRNGKKIYYSFEWGRRPGERIATGIWTYSQPKDQIQEDYNKKTLIILEKKRFQLLLTGYCAVFPTIPFSEFDENFFN